MTRPTPALLAEFDILLNYIKRTSSLGLTFDANADGPGRLLYGFSDASWEVRNSTTGYVIYWMRCPISWGSKRQHSIALSSCESEIIALSEASKDVVYLRKLIGGLCPSAVVDPSVLATDNMGARDLSYNSQHHDKSKHVQRRHFYVRDMVEDMQLTVPFVPTDDNVADIFTKVLKPKRFITLRNLLMGTRVPGAPPSFAASVPPRAAARK